MERLHKPRLTGPYYCQLALAYSYLGEPEPARAAGQRAVGWGPPSVLFFQPWILSNCSPRRFSSHLKNALRLPGS